MAHSGKKASEAKLYRSCVITFLDILGFRDVVAKRSAKEIDDMLTLLQQGAARDPALAKELSQKTITFSDSVIRTVEINSKGNREARTGILFHEIIDLVHVQLELAYLGIFLRGGVTIGDMRIHSNRYFGPGFIRAYELESKYALYPRIVIDPRVLRELEKNKLLRSSHNSIEDEIGTIRKLLRRDADGLWFVDYLRAAQHEIDEPDAFGDFLQTHKERVTKNATALKEDHPAAGKMLWLAHYHNAITHEATKQLQANGYDVADLIIDSTAIQLMYDFAYPESHAND
jgi:hypothetical protein